MIGLQTWFTDCDAGPTLNQHWLNVVNVFNGVSIIQGAVSHHALIDKRKIFTTTDFVTNIRALEDAVATGTVIGERCDTVAGETQKPFIRTSCGHKHNQIEH